VKGTTGGRLESSPHGLRLHCESRRKERHNWGGEKSSVTAWKKKKGTKCFDKSGKKKKTRRREKR